MTDRTQLSDPVWEYAEAHSTPHSNYLHHVERRTHLTTLAPQMLSGRMQGRLLSMYSKMMRPRLVVEVGTFTAYATLCLAEGLAPEGRIITIEAEEERERMARDHIEGSAYADRIELRMGDAVELLPDVPDGIDIAFLDGNKRQYGQYFDLLIDKVRPGGLLLADNVLWDGRVADTSRKDKDADLMRAFNAKVRDDERVEQLILPLRDGLTMMVKR